MNLFEQMMNRRSVRSFEDRPLSENLVNELLDAANNAPSGGNIQPLSMVVVEEPARRGELAEIAGGQPWVRNAPLSIVFCIDFHRVKRWAALFDVAYRGDRALASFLIAYADIVCAAQNVVILAQSHGLGSVYVGTIQSNLTRAREFIQAPQHVLPMLVLCLGYPRRIPRGIPKLARNAVVHRERYRDPDDDELRAAFEDKYGELDQDKQAYLEKVYVEVVEAAHQQKPEWLEAVKEKMDRLEVKSNPEFLFKLRYPQEAVAALNRQLLHSLLEAGFDWS